MRRYIEKDKFLTFRAYQGDNEAFGKLFDRYSGKIYRFIFYKVSIKEVAEDLASQCFLKIWEQISAGIKIKNFQALCYRIARNLVIDYYRSREKEELPLIYQIDKNSEYLKINPDENLDAELLKKILFSLKSDVREIIILRYVEQLSIKEIAQVVEKSPAHVRVIIHRAIKELNSLVTD